MSQHLFADYDLHSALEHRKVLLREAINNEASKRIRGRSLAELVDSFVTQFRISAPELTEAAANVLVEETPIDVSQDWTRAIHDRSRPYYIPGLAITYFVPFAGDKEVFRCRPRTFTAVLPCATLTDNELAFRFERTDGDVAATRKEFDYQLALVRQYLGWATQDIERTNNELPNLARQLLSARLARLEHMDSGLRELGLPVRQLDAAASDRARQMPAPVPTPTERYDVALSFAGEDREYVDEVARVLRSAGVSVFYDRFEKATLWGKNLVEHFTEIYQKRSKYVVMFISQHYINKPWPRFEGRQAQVRALLTRDEYILPARFDDTEVPGLAGTVGHVDLKRTSPEQLADLILEKLGKPRSCA